MARSPKAETPKQRLRVVRMAVSRPRLLASLSAGAVAGAACNRLFPQLQASTSFIIGWDVLCVAFMLLMWLTMLAHDADHIRRNAARDDEGRNLILGLVLVAAGVSVAALAKELSLAKAASGVVQAEHVALAFTTVAVSWSMVQAIFALHYAHEFYSRSGDGKGDAGGLYFPGKEQPDYLDFIHFAVVIGVASQTADIAFTSKVLRRVGTVHSLVAFVFNTLIVALTINLLAGLF